MPVQQFNPVLNGIFRGLQLASLVQNQRTRQQNAESLQQARQDVMRHRAVQQQRQMQLDQQREAEAAFERQLQMDAAGFIPIGEDIELQLQAATRGERIPVFGMDPGGVTARVPTPEVSLGEGVSERLAPGRLRRPPEGGTFFAPSAEGRGEAALRRRLAEIERTEQRRIDVRRRNEPTLEERIGEIEAVEEARGRTRARFEKPPTETPAQKRARLNFERGEVERQTSERIEATASILLDDAGGDPEEALKMLDQRARPRLGKSTDESAFLKRHRIAVQKLLKQARTETTRSGPNAGDRALSQILGVNAEQLDVMRAVSRDMPLKLARAIEGVRNQPSGDGEGGFLAALGFGGSEELTLEDALAAEGVSEQDLAVLRAAGIDVGQLGKSTRRTQDAGAGQGRKKPADPLGIR